jgi:hypothetical protein
MLGNLADIFPTMPASLALLGVTGADDHLQALKITLACT